MTSKKLLPLLKIFLASILSLLSLVACNWNTPPTAGTPGGLPTSILTDVAGTIQAQMTSAVEANPATVTPPPPTPRPSSTPIATVEAPQAPIPAHSATPTPTFTLPALPTIVPTNTITPLPTQTKTMVPSLPSTNQAAAPTLSSTAPSYVVSQGDGYSVENLNIPDCGVPWAIFRIQNSSNAALESLNLYLYNVSTNKALYGPSISDTPFIDSDRLCQTGWIDLLGKGGTLYIGGPLSNTLKGQSIRATLTLCTKEGLAGTCYQRTVEFILP